MRRTVTCQCLAVVCTLGAAAAFVAPSIAPSQRSALSWASASSVGRTAFATGRALGGAGPSIGRTQAKRSGLIGLRAEADYYADLGISRGADEKEIKSAFRQKARKLHPDVNKADDAQMQFQKIQQAYEVLSDPQKKSMYDR